MFQSHSDLSLFFAFQIVPQLKQLISEYLNVIFGQKGVKIKDFLTINKLIKKRICWLSYLSSFLDWEQLKKNK